MFLFWLRFLLLLPFGLAEHIFRKRKILHTRITHPPVFILGHQRSGTTLLHKLLACDEQFCFLDTYDVLLPYSPAWWKRWTKPVLQRLLRVFQVQNPHFNQYAFNLGDPLEEDFFTLGLAAPCSSYWGDAFPLRRDEFSDSAIFFKTPGSETAWAQMNEWLVKKTTLRAGGKRFLSKNPPHTGRVRPLLRQFPDARFIYLYRNPYQVFYSTFAQWQRTIRRFYMLQEVSDATIESIVFRYYSRLLESYELEKTQIPTDNLVEVCYEELKKAPIPALRSVYSALGLQWTPQTEHAMTDLLEAERRYSNYTYCYDPVLNEKIYRHWGDFIDRWGYRPPE